MREYVVMKTNIDKRPWVATSGCRVRIRGRQTEKWRKHVPTSWSREGIVRGLELDIDLTEMNKIGIRVYRILVDFGDHKVASLLPCLLRRCALDTARA